MLCASSSAMRVSGAEAAAGCGVKADVPAGLGVALPPEQVHSTPTPISVTSKMLKPLSSST